MNADGAACRGRWALFDSTDLRDHKAAREICGGCPVLASCARLLREVQETTSGVRGSGGGPAGTWAGKLIGRKGYRSEAWEIPECGTDRGYYQHRSSRSRTCDACRAAHAAAERARKVAS